MTLEQFRAERTTALRSLDRSVILAFARRWGARLPAEDGDVFWGSVHKARLVAPEMTEAEKAVSVAWLAGHGFSAAAPRAAVREMLLQAMEEAEP